MEELDVQSIVARNPKQKSWIEYLLKRMEVNREKPAEVYVVNEHEDKTDVQ